MLFRRDSGLLTAISRGRQGSSPSAVRFLAWRTGAESWGARRLRSRIWHLLRLCAQRAMVNAKSSTSSAGSWSNETGGTLKQWIDSSRRGRTPREKTSQNADHSHRSDEPRDVVGNHRKKETR